METEEKELRICQRCGEAKPLSEYRTWGHVKSEKGITYSRKCRQCYSEIRSESQKNKKPKKVIENRQAKLFAFWMSLPGIAKDEKYFERASAPKLDPDQESLIKDLVGTSTLNGISKLLNIDVHTLIRWKKNPLFKKMVEKFDMNNDATRFKRDVDYSFTRATIKHADAARVKLWKQLYEGWVEKDATRHELDAENIIGIQEQLKALAVKNINDTKGLPTTLRIDHVESWTDAGGPGESEADSPDAV